VSLDVHDLTVTVDRGRNTLITGISFPVSAKCLLAVVGPSGAGKSTLLNALTGLRPADHGTVLYDGRDLYREYAELRQRIGLVPQDDILHAQLTVRRALV
jgi:ABC-type multidrug transport system ATPase subunit